MNGTSAWLGVWTEGTVAQGSGPEVVTAAVGETVTLPAPVTADVLLFIWYRGTATLEPQRILGYLVSTSTQNNGPQHTGRESGRPNGTLRITDLRTSDTGNYTVSVTLSDGSSRTGHKQLRVYETDPLPAFSTCSCWQLTLGVASGVVLGAAVIVTGVVLYYKRRLNQKGTEKVIQNPETHYENTRKGRLGPPDNEAMSSDSAYMELKHGDRATYEQITRSGVSR